MALSLVYLEPGNPYLQQGDVLEKSTGIQAILKEIHPYYETKDDYTHFIVLTQSCDLVRRNSEPCKARYITLAAIRPMSVVVEREVAKYQREFAKKAKVCKRSVRDRVYHFVEQLLNNNVPEYFYLHPEPTLNFPDPSCAFIRLSVSIRSISHYDACFEARLLSLKEIFQAKLGWLVGNMYSRVGTEDWVPRYATAEDFKGRIDTILDETCKWVDEKQLKEAETTAPDGLLEGGQAVIREHIEATCVPKRRDMVAGAVMDELRKLGIAATAEESNKIEQRLRSNTIFKQYTK